VKLLKVILYPILVAELWWMKLTERA